MANNVANKAKERKPSAFKMAIIKKLTLAPEKRNQDPKPPYEGGRFSFIKEIFKRNLSAMSLVNLLILLFALPMIAYIAYYELTGTEEFAYKLVEITQKPYVMGDIGIGLSSASGILETKATVLWAYKALFLGIALCMPILGIGLGGAFHVASKFVWGEDFIYKKDKYGNNVPRVVKEFFIGVKKYWLQMLIVMAVFMVFFAGISYLIIMFVQGVITNNVGAGEIIGLIVGCLLGLPALLTLFNLLPMVVMYDIPLLQKVKNAFLLSVGFPLPTLFIFIIATLPMVFSCIPGILRVLGVLVLVTVGFAFFVMVSANYLGYNGENILIPLYENTQKTTFNGNGGRKKKDRQDNPKYNYKHKK